MSLDNIQQERTTHVQTVSQHEENYQDGYRQGYYDGIRDLSYRSREMRQDGQRSGYHDGNQDGVYDRGYRIGFLDRRCDRPFGIHDTIDWSDDYIDGYYAGYHFNDLSRNTPRLFNDSF